jgi:hypothetical protein
MDTTQLFYALAFAALVYLIAIHPWRENMTTADVQAKQDFHASNPSGWHSVTNPELHTVTMSKRPASTKKKAAGNPIIGPEVPEIDLNQPQPVSDGTSKNGTGVYPDIYGPEMLKEPGHKDSRSILTEDKYDIRPASEFPAGPEEPQPYLNDFSKILKM